MTDQEIRQAVISSARPGLDGLVQRMSFETVTHCWCGGRLEPWLEEFPLYPQCAECGCKSVRFRPTGASLEMLYSGFYWTDYQAIHSCPTIEQRHEQDMLDRVPQYLDWMRQLILPPARSLEIGCGNGRLLAESSRAGYECAGCEMDARVATWVQQKTGVTVHTGPLPPLSAGTYDLILALDVLEHIPDQRRFVGEVCARLRPGGKVMIHTPIIDTEESAREWRSMFNPLSHVWMHTTESLTRLWAEAGFRMRRLGELFAMPCVGLEAGP